MNMRPQRKWAAWLIVALNVFDVVITFIAISRGASEGNPLSAWLITTRALVPLKLGVSAFAAWGLLRKEPITLWTLCIAWAVIGIYSLTAALNTIHAIIGS